MLTRAQLKTSLMKVALLLVAALCAAPQAAAQVVAPAAVTGRVTDGARGVAGVVVTLMSTEPSTRFRAVARARTDGDGRYRISNVQPGRYKISPIAPVYVVQGLTDDWPPGKPLTLAAGEEVSDIDFRVERGGVITGRVSDADGNPVIAEQISIVSADKDKPFQWRGMVDPRDISTDDRGVFRLYGLPPGRYRVSIGQSDENGAVSFRRKLYRRTFHPDTTDETQARIVEVTAGSEAADVDITVGRALKTYRASGRFISAETGEPVPNISLGYGVLDPQGRRIASYGSGGSTTNARGEFQTEGLAPGRYAIFAFPREDSEMYSDAVTFEIRDAEVQGLVVRMRRGATVSGVVQIEGTSDRANAARLLAGIRLFGFVERRAETLTPDFGRALTVGADGSFRITGLRAGKLRISLSDERTRQLTVSRVELNGANVTGGIDVAEDAQVAGVRVVLVYGSGVVSGQVNFTNGTLPVGSRLTAFARRVAGGEDQGVRASMVDARGRFVIEGLVAGEYDVHVQGITPATGQRYQSEHQHISLADSGDTSVTLTLDLSGASKGGRP